MTIDPVVPNQTATRTRLGFEVPKEVSGFALARFTQSRIDLRAKGRWTDSTTFRYSANFFDAVPNCYSIGFTGQGYGHDATGLDRSLCPWPDVRP